MSHWEFLLYVLVLENLYLCNCYAKYHVFFHVGLDNSHFSLVILIIP